LSKRGSVNRFSGILFDLDGTLVDSLDLVVECFIHTCRTHLGTTPTREWIIGTIGRPLAGVLDELAPGRGPELLAAYSDYHERRHDELIRPFPPALDVVRALHRQGMPLGIVTSKRRHVAKMALELFDLADLFTTVVALEDTTRHKPQPDPLLAGAARLALLPRNVLYVGDSVHDILAAKAAGMPVASVLWGAGSREALLALHPNVVLAQPADLLAWLLDRTSS